MRHALPAATVLALLAAAPAWAQNQQMTQPSTSQNQSQAVQNQGQQPPEAREVSPQAPVATETKAYVRSSSRDPAAARPARGRAARASNGSCRR